MKALLVLLLTFISVFAEHELYPRTPPFGIVEPNSASRHLGDYTHSHETVDKSTYSCFAIGECQKTQPYCLEYGNKEAVRCEWDDPELADKKNQTSFYDDNAISLPSFRACPRVKSVERIRIIQFEGWNAVVAVVSLLVFFWRQRKIAHEQYQQLAQRIGVTVV
ncbi:uncharacterized protein B0P05DRAFT_574262 [Gilbertella persicaria]|uniref:uncharacterized protein n=1 Tax=Gilbertella persicaria TaxID=101096 RepID=UPI0022205668|nr:uncharacterized protein B0P05DRAFT_574262 [Gilbertella persicaria]KAI8063702.1 hypothetical protein B0P05DRAFT_574262 [Gilbertella persicaria]